MMKNESGNIYPILKRTLLLILALLAMGSQHAFAATTLDQELLRLAKQGDPHAQEKVAKTLFNSSIRQEKLSGVQWYLQLLVNTYGEDYSQTLEPVWTFLINEKNNKTGAKRETLNALIADYKRQADQGSGDAYLVLGTLYYCADDKDKESTNWNDLAKNAYLSAAANGNAKAAFMLGMMERANYLTDDESEQKAIAWFRKASELGYGRATAELAGHVESESERQKLYEKAAAQGYTSALKK